MKIIRILTIPLHHKLKEHTGKKSERTKQIFKSSGKIKQSKAMKNLSVNSINANWISNAFPMLNIQQWTKPIKSLPHEAKILEETDKK